MDEELKSIQSDLDMVLDRLARYMSSDRLQSPFNSPQKSGRDEAVRAAFCYAKKDGCSTLESAIHISRRPNSEPENYPEDSRLSEVAPEGGELSEVMAALRAIDNWSGSGWPLADRHMESLGDVVRAWAEKECSYLGEKSGLSLTPRKQVDPRRWDRQMAAWDVLTLHMEDPEKYPISEPLFELVGKSYGMSAKTVSRAYYPTKPQTYLKDPRKMREAFKELGILQWSETDKN